MTVFCGAERLAGVTAPATPVPEDAAVDLWSLTNPQLGEMCRERGVEPPKKAKKEALVARLTE